LCLRFFSRCALLFINIEDGGAILFPSIRSLAVDFGRIMRPPEQAEQFLVAGSGGIKRDLNGLRLLHVAGHDRSHSWDLLKNRLGTLVTTACEIGQVWRAPGCLRTKCQADE